MAVVYALEEWKELYESALRQRLCTSTGMSLKYTGTSDQRIYCPAKNYFHPNIRDKRHVTSVATPRIETPCSLPEQFTRGVCDVMGFGIYASQMLHNTRMTDIYGRMLASAQAPVGEHVPIEDMSAEEVMHNYDGDTLLRVVCMYACRISADALADKNGLNEALENMHEALHEYADSGNADGARSLDEAYEISKSTHTRELPLYFGDSTVRNHISVVREDIQGTTILDKQKTIVIQNMTQGKPIAIKLPILKREPPHPEHVDVLLMVDTSMPSLSAFLKRAIMVRDKSTVSDFIKSGSEYMWAQNVAVVNNMRVATLAAEMLGLTCKASDTAENMANVKGDQPWKRYVDEMLDYGLLLPETTLVGPEVIELYNTFTRMPGGSIVYSRNMTFSPAGHAKHKLLFCGPLSGYIIYHFVKAAHDLLMGQSTDPKRTANHVHDKAEPSMFFPRDCGRMGVGLKVVTPSDLWHTNEKGDLNGRTPAVLYSTYAVDGLLAMPYADPYFACFPPFYDPNFTEIRNESAIYYMFEHELAVQYYIPRAFTNVVVHYVGNPPPCFRRNVYPTFTLEWDHVFDHEHYDGMKLPRNHLIVQGVSQLVLKGVIKGAMYDIFANDQVEEGRIVLPRVHVRQASKYLFQLLKVDGAKIITWVVWRGTASECA